MQIHQYRPCPALAPYVNKYWEVQHDLLPGQTIAVPITCIGKSQIVFCLKNPFQCYKQGSQMAICDQTLFVQNALPYTKYFSGPTLGVVIEFTPTGLHELWPLPLNELSEQSLDLSTVLNQQVGEWTERLREAHSTAERFALLEKFLLQRLARLNHYHTDGRIEAAVAWIQRNPGQINLTQLANHINCSDRTFRRRFTQLVGVSPKYYVRMQRFIATRNWLIHQTKPTWQTLLGAGGYYDQAHLINEFNYFSGVAPTQYIHQGQRLHDFFYQ